MVMKSKKVKAGNNKSSVIGKGKITPFQVAFLVDRYLADNNFHQTRSSFRSEAASFISNSSPTHAPKSLRSLGELLDEYVWLKEERVILEQERCRIQTLLQGMQDVMNTYNSAVNCLTPPPPSPSVFPVVSGTSTSMPFYSSIGFPASRTPVMTSISTTQSVTMGRGNLITPICGGRPPRKRRIHYYKDLEDAPQASKKVYSGPLANYPFSDKVSNAVGRPVNKCSSKHSPPVQLSSPNFVQVGLPNQGSSVAKNLFDKLSQCSTSNSSIPITPPRAVSSPSEKSISPPEDASATAVSHNITGPLQTTPTNCTIISSKTIIVSPSKNYSIERKECKFSSPVIKRQSTREHVKGRLDFDSSDIPSSLENLSGDGSTSSESEKEGDIFNMDLPNFDPFGPEFSQLLTDFGISCANRDYSCPATACTSTDANVMPVHERSNEELGSSQDLIEHSSEATEVVPVDKTVNAKRS